MTPVRSAERTPAPPAAGPRFREALRRGHGIAAACVSAAAVSALLGALGWPFSLAAHWSLQLALALVAVAAVGLALGRRRGAAVAAILALALGVRMAWSASAGDPAPTGPVAGEIRLVLANVHTSNRRHRGLVDWVRTVDPDLLAVIEVNDRWLDALDEVRGRLPHRVACPKENNYGIGLYSRWPIRSGGVAPYGPWTLAQIDAVVDAPGGPVRVLVTHPPPPVRPEAHAMHVEVAAEMARRAAASAEPVILAGDLNATAWGATFRDLVRDGGFQRRRHGLLRPTWPDRFLLLPFGIAIDHVLVRGRLRVESQERGPDIGSDHRPVLLRIARIR